MPIPLRSAVVLGATGLVGSQLLRQLMADPGCERIVSLGRRPSGVTSPKLAEFTVDLAAPDTYRQHLAVDCVFCALGTTIAKAGSQEAFRRVDYEYPLAVAQAAASAGAQRYALVSAVGAAAKSRVFYNRVKGELEVALAALPFPRGVRVLHPSLLLGDRLEARAGEHVASVLMRATAPLFAGGLKKYRAIPADAVARALMAAARSEGAGIIVYEGASLFDAAGER
jgi:uncharacterized protein YbjT (DUF2867 family)